MDQASTDLPKIEAFLPQRVTLSGRHVRLEPLESRHTANLFKHLRGAAPHSLWQYMPDGPYEDHSIFAAAVDQKAKSRDPFFWAVIDESSQEAVGHLSFLRIDITHRVIEIGHIIYAAAVQRSCVTTESIFLLLKYAFDDLNFRRCEWKCNDLNEPSKRAATRFGFAFEGVFRQHMIVKGLNRDTAWFAIIDPDWPAVKLMFEDWLNPANFDATGRQRKSLKELRRN